MQYNTYSKVSQRERKPIDTHLFLSNKIRRRTMNILLSLVFCRSYRDGTGHNRTFIEAIRPLISPVILFASSTWWAYSSPNQILAKQPRIFFSAVGATFSNIAVRKSIASSNRCFPKSILYFSAVWSSHK